MGSVFTNAGQTRINQLAGLEQTLVIDRMVFANIAGLDPAAAIDRTQGMPDVGDIVHTATIDPANKGYVSPDQVVFSVILGSDLGDWSFNWIGLIEAATDTVIAITTLPLTPKTKTDVGSNTTGNCITRNFMIQFADAQNLTGISVAAETWQFNWQAEWNNHEQQIVDHTQEGTTGKHMTDSQYKELKEHTHPPEVPAGKIDLLPFRYNELPAGWFFCNGDNVLLTSDAGQALDALPANFKSDWGILSAAGYINLPNLFHTDGRGLFIRAVDGSAEQVGRIQEDAFKIHSHDIPMNRSGGWDGCYDGDPQTSGSASVCSDRNTRYTGSAETRPINTGMTPAIFLGV